MTPTDLVWCGVVGGPLFVFTALVLGRFRAHYDPVRLPISLLAVGDYGWIQIVNFVACGASIFVLAVGMRGILSGRGSMWGPLLIALVGLGLVGAGLFPTDPGGGFPPYGQAEPGPTVHGHLHDLFSVAVFVGLPSAMFVLAGHFFAQGAAGWGRRSMLCGVALAVGFVGILVAFNTDGRIADVGGLIQRLWVVVGFGWLSVVAVHLLHLEQSRRELEP